MAMSLPSPHLPSIQPNSTTDATGLAGSPAKVNPELLPHLTVHGEPHVSIPQEEMLHLEQALLSS